MMSAPAAAFALRIAWRSDPAPESAVVVTMNVAALSDVAKSAERTANPPRIRIRPRANISPGRSAVRQLLTRAIERDVQRLRQVLAPAEQLQLPRAHDRAQRLLAN